MSDVYGDVVLLTGASSGIGKATAVQLMKEGYKVYGTYRNNNNCKSRKGEKGFIEMFKMDVCSSESVKSGIKHILEKEGRIDILINNAGFGLSGAIEDFTEQEVLSQFETNFFGVHRVCRQVLPVMREQKRGLIINIGSVGGLTGLPFQSMYSASKAALDIFTQGLRMEIKQFGIKAVVVHPGEIKTEFTVNRQVVRESEDSIYFDKFKRSLALMEKAERNGSKPEVIAKTISRVLRKKNPPCSIISPFIYKVLVFFIKILPYRITEYVVAKLY